MCETTDNLKRILLSDSFPAVDDNENMMKKIQGFPYSDGFYKGTFWQDDHMAFVNNLVNCAENGVLVIADADI